MRTIVYFIMLLMSAVLLGSCEHKKPIAEPIETDSIEQEYVYVPTVYDVLEQRNELNYALWVDSVYLNMPEQILINILVTKGTTLSITEIVEDYVSNKDYYHNVVLKNMNIQKKYIPDSIPKQSVPSTHTQNLDSLPLR